MYMGISIKMIAETERSLLRIRDFLTEKGATFTQSTEKGEICITVDKGYIEDFIFANPDFEYVNRSGNSVTDLDDADEDVEAS